MVPIFKAMAEPGHSEANKNPRVDLIPDCELYPEHKSSASEQVGQNNTRGRANASGLMAPDKNKGLDHDQCDDAADQSARAKQSGHPLGGPRQAQKLHHIFDEHSKMRRLFAFD